MAISRSSPKIGMMSALLAAVILLASRPAAASDLYIVNANRPIYATQKPAPGKALIFLIRPGPGPGATVRKVSLYADGKFLGLLMADSFIALECAPGKHDLSAVGRNAVFLQADVRADRIYLVIAGINADVPGGGFGFTKDNVTFTAARPGSHAVDTVLSYLIDLHPIETTPEGMKWEQENQGKLQEIIAIAREKMDKPETLQPEDGFEIPPWQKKG